MRNLRLRTNDNVSTGCGCFTYLLVLIFNLAAGGWSVWEILSWFGKTIPVWGNVLIGLFTAELSVPVAVIGWVLKACGVF